MIIRLFLLLSTVVFSTAQAAEAKFKIDADNPKGYTATVPQHLGAGMVKAIEDCNLKNVKYFLDNGVKVDSVLRAFGKEGYRTPLRLSLKKVYSGDLHHPANTKSKKKSDIASFDGYYRDQYHGQKFQKCFEVVEYLLEQGADPNGIGFEEYSAVLVALERRTPEVVKTLLKHGAKAHQKSKDGWLPLLVLADSAPNDLSRCSKFCPYIEDTIIFNDLLAVATPAEINQKGVYGETALVRAVRTYSGGMSGLKYRVQAYLDAGANPCIGNDNKMNAIQYAIQKNAIEVAEMMSCE